MGAEAGKKEKGVGGSLKNAPGVVEVGGIAKSGTRLGGLFSDSPETAGEMEVEIGADDDAAPRLPF